MIVFDLECRVGAHRFEGWFSTTADFEHQQATGLLVCPICGADDVGKAVMAPNIGRKGNQLPQPAPAPATPAPANPAAALPMATGLAALPAEAQALFRAIATAQAEAIKASRWVGDQFADQARAMHYGEREAEAIHGQATPDEARDLLEEGVAVAPLLIPVVPPEQTH